MKWLRRLSILAVVLVILAGIGWNFRGEVLMTMAGVARRLANPVGPNQTVSWSAGPDQATTRPDERPPNIVLILADDMGFNDLSFFGGGVAGGSVPTPAIDSIGHEGVHFTNGYAGNAVCAPSRAMLMTGRYSTRFGFEFTPAPKQMALLAPLVFDTENRLRPPVIDRETAATLPDFAEQGMPADEITIAELLKQRGYQTLHIGKWHLGRVEGFRPRDQGFDESLLMASGLYLPQDHPDAVNSKQDFDPIDAFLWPNMQYAATFNDGDWFEPGGYITDYYTDEAIKAIEANRNRPFFLYLAHWAPHTPLQALRSDYEALSHIESHRLRVYAAMIRALDRSVARLLRALDDNGLAENTLVVFTSDNGGAHYIGLPEINHPYRGWKLTLFEGGTHVPFFMRWPGRIPAGSRFEEPVAHIDVFSTAAAAAGAALPRDRVIDGVDLLPHVLGEKPGSPHDAIFWREGYYRVVLANGWKLQVSEKPKKKWLFDLNTDPTEQKNLASQRPDKLRELEALLIVHNAQQAPPLWPSFIEMAVSIDKTLEDPESPDDEYIYWQN
jgi:uncharacterized sulfatase